MLSPQSKMVMSMSLHQLLLAETAKTPEGQEVNRTRNVGGTPPVAYEGKLLPVWAARRRQRSRCWLAGWLDLRAPNSAFCHSACFFQEISGLGKIVMD